MNKEYVPRAGCRVCTSRQRAFAHFWPRFVRLGFKNPSFNVRDWPRLAPDMALTALSLGLVGPLERKSLVFV